MLSHRNVNESPSVDEPAEVEGAAGSDNLTVLNSPDGPTCTPSRHGSQVPPYNASLGD